MLVGSKSIWQDYAVPLCCRMYRTEQMYFTRTSEKEQSKSFSNPLEGSQRRKPRGYWKSLSNQRQQFDLLAQKYNINQPSDWKKLSYNQIAQEGGRSVLKYYPSLLSALEAIYPEEDWKSTSIRTKLPNEHWDCIQNQRKFFDEVARICNIQQTSDWSNVTYKRVVELGGGTILSKYPSLQSALETIYPENDWKPGVFRRKMPANHWNDVDNQRELFDRIAQKYKISNAQEWDRVTYQEVVNEGGSGVLKQYTSLFSALKTIYPECEWEDVKIRSKTPPVYWENKENQRAFFNRITRKYNIKCPQDWNKVTYKNVVDEGGWPILKQYSSLFNALENVYGEYEWDICSSRSQVPQNYWKSIHNQRKFFDSFARRHKIDSAM